MRWLLEPDIFGEGAHPMTNAVREAGFTPIKWEDDWWNNARFPESEPRPTLFHGSLGNAARIAKLKRWKPGAFCDVKSFQCSSWYPNAKKWLIQERFATTTVEQLVNEPRRLGDEVGEAKKVFVRPDSPLKPFSGRVVRLENLSLKDLDHGLYYDNTDLPVVVSSLRQVSEEWRFVVVQNSVAASSSYQADGRTGTHAKIPDEAKRLADEIAQKLEAPEPVYVLDIGRTEGGLGLVELNPFSGADLYNCDYQAVVSSVAAYLQT